MSGKTIYSPHEVWVVAIFLLILVAVAAFAFVGLLGIAFSHIGLSPMAVILILLATFLGSFFNIPVAKLKTTKPMVVEKKVSFFGITYRIPEVMYGQSTTVLAVNVGGALIPTAVCIYILLRMTPVVVAYSFIGVFVVGLVTHLISRPVKGVGITSPPLVSPLTAAIIAVILQPHSPLGIAYVSGVLGTLIGADLTNLKAMPELGAPMASIGGAGTFDGVFLSGIIAVLIAGL